MSASLKLICLNIEKDKHLDRVIPSLISERPDVFCVQEIYESSVLKIAGALTSTEHIYAPMTGRPKEQPPEIQGLAIFSRVPIRKRAVKYYVGTPATVPDSVEGDPSTYNFNNRMVVACDVEKDGEIFRIATTHFTWTSDSQPTDEQRQDMRTMLDALEEMGEFALCGDFNVPRGGEMFSLIAAKYKDDIPLRYSSSLDPELHRAGHLPIMVDGLFTTPGYMASDVHLEFGISDHAAIIATISPE